MSIQTGQTFPQGSLLRVGATAGIVLYSKHPIKDIR